MEVLDEMFIGSLNKDYKVQLLSNSAAAKKCTGTVELGSPNLLIAARHRKGTVCQSRERTLKKFSVLWGHFWSSIHVYTVLQTLCVCQQHPCRQVTSRTKFFFLLSSKHL